MAVHEDPVDPSERLSSLEKENDCLRHQLDVLKREIQSQSPTRSARKSPALLPPVLGVVSDNSGSSTAILYEKLGGLSLNDKKEVKTPGKKVRKFTARKWDFMDENEMDAYENM